MSAPAFFRSDGWVKQVNGAAVPGAWVFVLGQPANTYVTASIASPPTPLVQIYADPNGLVPISQPVITDGFGHYDFYVAPGTYTVAIYNNTVLQQVYPDQSIGLGTGGGSGTVTVTGSPIAGNLTKFSGPTTITNGDLSGDVSTSGTLVTTLATTGVTPGSYTNTNITVDAKGRITAASNGSGGGSVTSVFGRSGIVVAQSGDYSVGQVTGAAPLASPALTGSPTAPTPSTGDNSTLIATTAFVKAQGYLTSAPVTSVFTRTGAVVATSGDYTAAQVTNAQDNSVSHSAGTFLGAPSGSSGTPSFRSLVSTDIPSLSATYQVVSAKDAANGYAGLDASGLLKTAEFPALTGDATSSSGGVATTVVKIQGRSVLNANPSNGQVLAWNTSNSDWEPTSISSIPSANASQLQSVNIASTTPVDRQVLKYGASGTNWFPQTMWDNYFAYQHNGGAAWLSSGAVVSGILVPASNAGSLSNIAASYPNFPGLQAITASTTGSGLGVTWLSTGVGSITPFQLWRSVRWQLKLTTTSSIRIWMGWGDQGNTAGIKSDSPAQNFVGYRYSTAASDTKYQCVTQTSAVNTTKTPESTSSHVDTSVHEFEILWDDTNVIFKIDGVQVGSQNTTLPLNSTGMGFTLQVDNVSTTTTPGMVFYRVFAVGRNS